MTRTAWTTSWMVAALALLPAGATFAVPGYLDQFATRYAAGGTVLDKCILCHGPSGPPLNAYGSDYAASGHSFGGHRGEATPIGTDSAISRRSSRGRSRQSGQPPGRWPRADTKRPVVRRFRIPQVVQLADRSDRELHGD